MKDKETMIGFGLVALVLGAGIAAIVRTIQVEVRRVNSSIQALPAGLVRAITGR